MVSRSCSVQKAPNDCKAEYNMFRSGYIQNAAKVLEDLRKLGVEFPALKSVLRVTPCTKFSF